MIHPHFRDCDRHDVHGVEQYLVLLELALELDGAALAARKSQQQKPAQPQPQAQAGSLLQPGAPTPKFQYQSYLPTPVAAAPSTTGPSTSRSRKGRDAVGDDGENDDPDAQRPVGRGGRKRGERRIKKKRGLRHANTVSGAKASVATIEGTKKATKNHKKIANMLRDGWTPEEIEKQIALWSQDDDDDGDDDEDYDDGDDVNFQDEMKQAR